MYYKALSTEYFRQAGFLKKHIKMLKTHSVKIDSSKNEKIRYRVSILYTMYLDLIHTADYLNRKYEVMNRD